MKFTKTQLTKLASQACSYGTFGLHEGERGTWSLICPVHHNTLDAARMRPEDGLRAHRFPVHHLPWEHRPTAGMVRDALARHLADADENGEPCDDLSKAVRG